MESPWQAELKKVNKYLRSNQHLLLAGKRCRMRVKVRPSQSGHHAIDLDGLWRDSEKETSRRLHTPVRLSRIQDSFTKALDEAEELISQGQLGRDTRRNLETYDRQALAFSPLTLKNQLKKAKKFLIDRGETKSLSQSSLKSQMRWADMCFAWAAEESVNMSMEVCADALLAYYSNRKRKSYRNAFDTMRLVCQHLGEPLGVRENQKPAYVYQAVGRTNIPEDEVIWQRINAIKNEDLKKHIYAIAVYGHRIMQIYSTDWSTFDKETGYVNYWATKNNYGCCAVPCPFGKDKWIDLSGWRPDNYEELFVTNGRPTGEVAQMWELRSSALSRAVTKHLGISATDLRHRYCSVSLITGLHTAATCAAAVGNSASMIERTYSRELHLYVHRSAKAG
tara:strand:- start:1188 stop:2366 length:1179 start_codon:yes stop_codon:yes gene_type:complete